MTQQERNIIAVAIFGCANFYGKDMHPDQVTAFVNTLIKHFNVPAQTFVDAFESYMADKNNKFFPAPVHLRQYIEPDVTVQDVSDALVADIVTAIRRHQVDWPAGYNHHEVGKYWRSKGNECHLSWEDAVRSELGDLGLEVVNRYTWRGLCDLYCSGNLVAFNSQLKNYIISVQNILKSGKSSTNVYALKPKDDRKQISDGQVRSGIQVYTRPTDDEPKGGA